MWRARAVSHQIINSPKPQPVANPHAITSASGAPRANTPHCNGHSRHSTSPVSNGRVGRQRTLTSAAHTAPTPATVSITPNTPAPP